MKTFTFSSNKVSNNFVVTDLEEETVNKLFESLTTKKAAVELLVKRGWSTKQISKKVRYDDGRELREQHINQIKQKMKK